jgi:hypothetical protein
MGAAYASLSPCALPVQPSRWRSSTSYRVDRLVEGWRAPAVRVVLDVEGSEVEQEGISRNGPSPWWQRRHSGRRISPVLWS